MLNPEAILDSAKITLARRGLQVVKEGSRLRVIGAEEAQVGTVLESIEALKGHDSTKLTESLEDMGMVAAVSGKYLTASLA